MAYTGKCACGSVSYKIEDFDLKEGAGACHCKTCQAWSGGVFIGIKGEKGKVVINNEEHLTTWTSSTWAERAFCKTCGSSVYYRTTTDGPGDYHFGAGTLEDWKDIEMKMEIFTDRKPNAYAFADAEGRTTMTAAETLAFFAGTDGADGEEKSD